MDDIIRKSGKQRFGGAPNQPHQAGEPKKPGLPGTVTPQNPAAPHFTKAAAASSQDEDFITPEQAASHDGVTPAPVGQGSRESAMGSLASGVAAPGSSQLASSTASPDASQAATPADALKTILEKNKAAEADKAYRPKPDPEKPKKKFRLPRPKTRQQWINTVLVALLVFGLLGGGAYMLFGRGKATPAQTPSPAPVAAPEPAAPTTVPSKLSGLPVAPDVNNRPVTAVMVENSPDARPQAGILDASIVYEAIAEGGITRFSLVYQDTQPDYIGPIRSVRPYYLDWIWPFDASLAHVGGAPQALSDIKSLGIRDLDQFANSGAYTRISSRYAPHNVYSSIAKFNELEQKKGWGTSTFTGFARKEEAKADVPTAKSIDVNISSFLYNSHYDYDATTNTYLRKQAGQPHKDDKSGKTLSPKVVIAVAMKRGIASDGQHTNYTTTGSGEIMVFQDGKATKGTWQKDGRKDQWVFRDSGGMTLKLNPGQTWITMVDSLSLVSYKP